MQHIDCGPDIWTRLPRTASAIDNDFAVLGYLLYSKLQRLQSFGTRCRSSKQRFGNVPPAIQGPKPSKDDHGFQRSIVADSDDQLFRLDHFGALPLSDRIPLRLLECKSKERSQEN